VEFARRQPGETGFRAVARVTPEPARVLSDLELTAADGRVVLRVLGRSEEIVRLPGDFYRYWSSPRQIVLSRPLRELFHDVPGAASCAVCELGTAAGNPVENRLWSQALARMILNAEERRVFGQLKLPPVPAASWLLGRAVVKDAVRLQAALE